MATDESQKYSLLSCLGIPHSLYNQSLLHPPLLYTQEASEWLQKNYVPTDNEIFVASYSKTGSTFTQQILHEIMHCYFNNTDGLDKENCRYYQNTSGFYSYRKWIESSRSASMQKFNEYIQNTQNTLRFWKTHANLEYFPSKQLPKKMIVICRNPKDVAVSFYHHYKNVRASQKSYNFTDDFDTFFTLFVAGLVDNGTYFDWYKAYWKLYIDNIHHQKAQIYWLNYEDLVRDDESQKTQIKKLIKFIGVDDMVHLEQDIQQVIDNTSIHQMQKQYNRRGPIKRFVRKGGIGGWKQYFTKQQNEMMDALILIHFNGEGSTFKYYMDLQNKQAYLCFDSNKSKL